MQSTFQPLKVVLNFSLFVRDSLSKLLPHQPLNSAPILTGTIGFSKAPRSISFVELLLVLPFLALLSQTILAVRPIQALRLGVNSPLFALELLPLWGQLIYALIYLLSDAIWSVLRTLVPWLITVLFLLLVELLLSPSRGSGQVWESLLELREEVLPSSPRDLWDHLPKVVLKVLLILRLNQT